MASSARNARSASLDSRGGDMVDSGDEDNVPAATGVKGKGKTKTTKAGSGSSSRTGRAQGDQTGPLNTLGESDRKAQNRIAQREFRQRKQAYIKELEAKVQLHELGRDEQLERLTEGIKSLLDENQQLRHLLQGVSAFIGEGLGGALPRLGTTLPGLSWYLFNPFAAAQTLTLPTSRAEFQSLISRNTIDTATDALRLVPSSRLGEHAPAVASGSSPTATRASQAATASPAGNSPSSSTLPPPAAKRARTSLPQVSAVDSSFGGFAPTLIPSHPLRSASGPASNAPEPPQYPASTSGDGRGVPPASTEAFQLVRESFQKGDVLQAEEDIRSLFTLPSSTPNDILVFLADHMKNKRENPNYTLPPSLRATVTQQTVPHPPFFDGIIFASLRDRLILLKDQYPLAELTRDLVDSLDIHGNDILQSENWEVSEHFLRKYWCALPGRGGGRARRVRVLMVPPTWSVIRFVVDHEVLKISNRWRRERGEPDLTMRCIVPGGEEAMGSRGGGGGGGGGGR
ncbi:SPOSA6832_01191, partial [Sporobolomyces salmonicolor]